MHQIMTPLKPISGTSGLIALDMQAKSYIISIKEGRTRVNVKTFNQNGQK